MELTLERFNYLLNKQKQDSNSLTKEEGEELKQALVREEQISRILLEASSRAFNRQPINSLPEEQPKQTTQDLIEEFEKEAPIVSPTGKEKLLRQINNAIALSKEHLEQIKKQSEKIERYLDELGATRMLLEQQIDQIPSLWDIDIETEPLSVTYVNTEADVTITIDRGEDSK